LTTYSAQQTIRHLRELIAALDWRLPQVKRMGEAKIAREAADLRRDAIRRIAELEHELASATATATDCGLESRRAALLQG
jgi:hypothetical protein